MEGFGVRAGRVQPRVAPRFKISGECVCVCVRERERERERGCVCERERERRKRERERERERRDSASSRVACCPLLRKTCSGFKDQDFTDVGVRNQTFVCRA